MGSLQTGYAQAGPAKAPAICCALLLCAVFPAHAAAPDNIVQVDRHYDGVLGTSMDLSIHAPDAARIEAAANAAVTEIARLEQILSTWIEDSELMQLNRNRSTTNASPELLEVVSLCEDWYQQTSGIFSCRLGGIIDLWTAAERSQVLPVVSEILPVARAVTAATIVIDPAQRRIELGDPIRLEPSGLAKGYIIDKAMAVLRQALPDAIAIQLDIGGDASYWGVPPDRNRGWLVGVADPVTTADNTGFVTTLDLAGMAVATSGHTSRTYTIDGRKFSHIFDTRRGWPVLAGTYAVVVAPTAVIADAVATALAVQNPEPGLAWANTLDNIEVFLVGANGIQHTSKGWRTHLSEEVLKQAEAKVQLTLDYTIPQLNERGYERPYVAVWISDMRGRFIRNLLLLGAEQSWASNNSRWWNSTTRRVDSITRPTRGPGEYQLVWDGVDYEGIVLPPGEYLLNIEAAREGGDHTYKRVQFMLGEGTQTIEEAGEDEIGDFSVTIEMTMPQ